MSYTIRPSGDSNYILLVVHGEIKQHLAMKYNPAAHTLAKELGID